MSDKKFLQYLADVFYVWKKRKYFKIKIPSISGGSIIGIIALFFWELLEKIDVILSINNHIPLRILLIFIGVICFLYLLYTFLASFWKHYIESLDRLCSFSNLRILKEQLKSELASRKLEKISLKFIQFSQENQSIIFRMPESGDLGRDDLMNAQARVINKTGKNEVVICTIILNHKPTEQALIYGKIYKWNFKEKIANQLRVDDKYLNPILLSEFKNIDNKQIDQFIAFINNLLKQTI